MAKQLPARVKLLNWGKNPTSNGDVIVDDMTLMVFSVNQHITGRDRVAVDFEHNTVPGTPEYERTHEPRPVAGHSTLACLDGEGIFAENIVYTPQGESLAANYEDVSLAPLLDKVGRVVAAHSWTLTHAGAAYGMSFTPLSAMDARVACLSATKPFLPMPAKKFRTVDAKGNEVVDLAALFNAEHQQSEAAAPQRLATLSAEQQRRFRLPDGRFDWSAYFTAEAVMNGLQR